MQNIITLNGQNMPAPSAISHQYKRIYDYTTENNSHRLVSKLARKKHIWTVSWDSSTDDAEKAISMLNNIENDMEFELPIPGSTKLYKCNGFIGDGVSETLVYAKKINNEIKCYWNSATVTIEEA